MLVLLVAKKLAEFFLYMLAGFILIRTGMLKREDTAAISRINLYAFCPAMLVRVFQVDVTPTLLRNLGAMAVLSFVIHLLLMLIARSYRIVSSGTPVEEGCIIYTNCGNLLIPLIAYVFDSATTIFVTPYVVVFNLLVWTHGLAIFAGRGQISLKAILKNINLISLFTGAVLMLLNVRITGVPLACMNGLADMVGPVSMIITGMLLGQADRSDFRDPVRLAGVCAVRMLFCPAVILALLFITKAPLLMADGRLLFMIILLAVGAPSATTINQFAVLYDHDAEYAGIINLITTLISLVTLPLLVHIFELLF